VQRMGALPRGWLALGLLLAALMIGLGIWYRRPLAVLTPPSPTATSNPETSISLGQAFSYGLVEGKIRGPDDGTGNNLILTVRHVLTPEITLGLPQGSLLLNSVEAEPNMIVRRLRGQLSTEGQIQPANVIRLSDDMWHQYVLEAYSLDFEKGKVSPQATFSLLDPSQSEVLYVLEAADRMPDVSPEAIQIAIWAITDGVNSEALSGKGYQPDLGKIRTIFEAAGLDPKHKRLFDQSQFQAAQDYVTRGDSYYQMGEYVQALADYTKAIAMQSDCVEAFYQRGVAFRQQQNYARAITDFAKVTELASQQPMGYFALGEAYYSEPDPEYAKAITNLNKAIELDGSLTDAYYIRGLVYAAMQGFDKAIQDFTQVIERNAQSVDAAYYARGLAHAAKAEFDKAIEDYGQAIERNGQFADAYYTRGETYSSMQEYSKAIADFNEVISLSPDFAEAYRARGMNYYAKNEYGLARRDLQRYLELAPSATDAQEVAGLITVLQEPPPTPGPGSIALAEALDQKLVKVEIHGLGVVSGDSILLELSRTTTRELEIALPQGTVLSSHDSNEQLMVVRQLRGLVISEAELQPAAVIHLADDESKKYYVEAYSLDFHRTTPLSTTVFLMQGSTQPEVLAILKAADKLFGAGGDAVDIQTTIWSVTDDVGWLDLAEKNYVPNMQAVQAILQTAGLDLRRKRLFGGESCTAVTDATPTPTSAPQSTSTPVATHESKVSDNVVPSSAETGNISMLTPTPTRSPTVAPSPTTAGSLMPTATPTPPASACSNQLAQITEPLADAVVRGNLEVRGTANIPNLHFYKVQFRPESSGNWGELYKGSKPVVNGVLMVWVTRTVAPGVYWLRLIVEDPTGNYPEPCEVRVVVAR
jgi:tetratricopeptide (TPR) repeat protein